MVIIKIEDHIDFKEYQYDLAWVFQVKQNAIYGVRKDKPNAQGK